MMVKLDRGAHRSLRLEVCARGFLINSGGEFGNIGTLYAFNTIGEVADWLVDEYSNAHTPSDDAKQGADA